ncbi:MAG: hypothetical protein WBP16_00370 [Ferruginibacter sp.]
MKFFSKIAVIFNISFVLAVVLRYIEKHYEYEGTSKEILPLPWLKGTLVILGQTAIIVNTLFLIIYFVYFSFSIKLTIPRWIIIFNIIIFCCQVYFHFISK